MSFPYQSATVAFADLALTPLRGLRRHKLTQPHRCNSCGRTATTIPASRAVTSKGVPCRRVRWSLSLCPGSLIKAVTS